MYIGEHVAVDYGNWIRGIGWIGIHWIGTFADGILYVMDG